MNRITLKKSERLGYFDTAPTYNDWSRIGSFNKLVVYIDESINGYLEVEVVDPTVRHGRSPQRVKRVLSIQLSKSEFKAYHIDMTKLDMKYSGKGIAAKAYRYIIKKLSITLQAGSCQSRGGRKVWFDLAQCMDLDVFAKTKCGQPKPVGIDCEEREVWIDKKDIYDGDKEMYVFAKRFAA